MQDVCLGKEWQKMLSEEKRTERCLEIKDSDVLAKLF
jgi:hypothetical protein